MSFPITLSPSPVHEAFAGILWDPLDSYFKLEEREKSLLRAADNHVLGYTLSHPGDAAAYLHVLLKVLEQTRTTHNYSQSIVARLPLDQILSDTEALEFVDRDSRGIVTHYAVTQLTDSVQNLKQASKKSKVTIASVFYPDGILMEDWRLFRLLMNGNDAFAQRGAAFALACILLEGRTMMQPVLTDLKPILESFVSWMTSKLQSSNLAIVTPSLTILMVDRLVRELFDNAGGIGYLSRHLRRTRQTSSSSSKPTSVQQLYELCYCLWLVSYDCDSNEKIRNHFHRDGAVSALAELVALAPREKVVRLALCTLTNLALCKDDENTRIFRDTTSRRSIDGSTFLQEMVACGLDKSIGLCREREWSDPDLVEDVEKLHTLLSETCREMTRYDVYEVEVDSGHLQWSKIHSEKFFRENARRMEGKDGKFGIVKALMNLAAGDDEEVAAIACFDIGEFVRHYPSGRALVKRLGMRNVVMELIEHENPELQRQALQCVSKMLVNNWQMSLTKM